MRAAQTIMGDLAGAGLTPEQLALVMELSAALVVEARPAIDKAAEKKRAYDREYRRTHKDEIVRNRTKSYETNELTSPNERENLTPTRREKPKPNGLVKKADRGTRLSADWKPEPLIGKAAAMVANWQPGAIERELAKFKNYWLAKGANAARTDWQRTWVNWLISADERTPRQAHERSTNPTVDAVNRILGDIRNGGPAGQDPHAGSPNVDDDRTAGALAARRH